MFLRLFSRIAFILRANLANLCAMARLLSFFFNLSFSSSTTFSTAFSVILSRSAWFSSRLRWSKYSFVSSPLFITKLSTLEVSSALHLNKPTSS